MNRNSQEWGSEIARLDGEKNSTAAETQRLTAELGSAYLDSPESAAGLQQALVTAQARLTGLSAALTQAQARQQAALAEEQRQRQSLDARAYLAIAARWVVRAAEARELHQAMADLQARQSPALTADRAELERLRPQLANIDLPSIEALVTGNAEQLRVKAADLKRQSERISVQGGQLVDTGEVIDPAALPPAAPKADRAPTPIARRAQEVA